MTATAMPFDSGASANEAQLLTAQGLANSGRLFGASPGPNPLSRGGYICAERVVESPQAVMAVRAVRGGYMQAGSSVQI